jgi:tRNA1(Val) A37 N6-methylase TrmN6
MQFTLGIDGSTPAPINDVKESEYKIFAKDRIIDCAFDYYRSKEFPYPHMERHEMMQMINDLSEQSDESLMYSSVGARIADVYNPHRFDVEIVGKYKATETFKKDVALKKSLRLLIENQGKIGTGYFSILSLVNGTQVAANFKPGYSLLMYRRYAFPGATVLDTSTGFGGRLVGFMASDCGKYIGVDPNTLTCQCNQRMVDDLGFHDKVTIINLPVEDVPFAYANTCDFAFTSPPYFSKEHYCNEETQSWKRYSTGEAWKNGFLKKMLAFQFHALKPGAKSVINISDVKIKDVLYPLAQWTIDCAKEVGFIHVDNEKYPMSRLGANLEDKPKYEPAPVFMKPKETTKTLTKFEEVENAERS